MTHLGHEQKKRAPENPNLTVDESKSGARKTQAPVYAARISLDQNLHDGIDAGAGLLLTQLAPPSRKRRFRWNAAMEAVTELTGSAGTGHLRGLPHSVSMPGARLDR
ncbi:hypothetical protein [Mesorhizobium sp. M0276]|uniref:hypothetical protein n=1 Tax=Mesorhizobium sp. M0276 TaxID=2956928 RepID=UPI00333D57B1